MGPRGEMINAITFVGVEKELSREKSEVLGSESTRIDNLAIENAINPRLNLIRASQKGNARRNPKKFFSPQAQNIYEYKLKNIFALSSS